MAAKKLVPVRPNHDTLVSIQYETGGGAIPDQLKGKYTGEMEAMRAIKNYEAKQKQKRSKPKQEPKVEQEQEVQEVTEEG